MRTEYLENIDLVSFDVWKTLIVPGPEEHGIKRAELIRDLLAPTENVHFVHELSVRVSREQDALMDSTGVQYGLTERIRGIYDLLPREKRVPTITDQVIELLDSYQAGVIRQYPPKFLEKDLLDTLSQLRGQGLSLALISNTGYLAGRHMLPVLKDIGILEYLEYTLFSDEVGVAKPNHKIFDALKGKSGLEGQRIVHVGDNYLADYRGAISAGLKSLHLSRNTTEDSVKIPNLRTLVGNWV